MLDAQGIRATGFKRAQGNAHCAKFESHTNRVTFETNAIRMTSSVQAHEDFITYSNHNVCVMMCNAIVLMVARLGPAQGPLEGSLPNI